MAAKAVDLRNARQTLQDSSKPTSQKKDWMFWARNSQERSEYAAISRNDETLAII
jgi:hypothetical protein